ncbi:RNA polymerase sigma factor [Microbacterium phyllosphaerae]|uniref:RNA polymerase sigma factor n=1 Tax=Microbacterium phyllosphaerae TaxID=124798 RepID=UPI002166ED7B|nr:RNA polymerase sigma factor [Microbacterium phyllosphaerae]MCS3442166.1 RNA polymerase sigma-70 factor (ECF subfamily) [Microbacterium phyllosphaerae]
MPDYAELRAPEDGELLFRLSKGDEPAYRMLHDRHQAPVFRLSLVLMRTSWDAEEVAATAFFELWRKRDKVRVVDGSVLPWLLATTSYAAKNSLRSRRRYHRLLSRIPHDGNVPDHADEVGRAMDMLKISEQVRDALRELNSRDSGVVVLCIIHELPTAEAAIVLGIPEGTVKSRLSRVKARLRGTLNEYAPRAEGANA